MKYLNIQIGGGRHNSIINNIMLINEQAILIRHIILLRKTEYYTNTNKKIRALFFKIKLYRLQNKYSLHIPINTCGKGLKIMHVGPILINHKAKIGENVSIHINTAIVAGGTDNNAPKIGNGVVIGVGAVILGGIHISNNVAIGANAVVNKDVLEEDIAVAGVPAKKISNNGRTKWNVPTEYIVSAETRKNKVNYENKNDI